MTDLLAAGLLGLSIGFLLGFPCGRWTGKISMRLKVALRAKNEIMATTDTATMAAVYYTAFGERPQ